MQQEDNLDKALVDRNFFSEDKEVSLSLICPTAFNQSELMQNGIFQAFRASDVDCYPPKCESPGLPRRQCTRAVRAPKPRWEKEPEPRRLLPELRRHALQL